MIIKLNIKIDTFFYVSDEMFIIFLFSLKYLNNVIKPERMLLLLESNKTCLLESLRWYFQICCLLLFGLSLLDITRIFQIILVFQSCIFSVVTCILKKLHYISWFYQGWEPSKTWKLPLPGYFGSFGCQRKTSAYQIKSFEPAWNSGKIITFKQNNPCPKLPL